MDNYNHFLKDKINHYIIDLQQESHNLPFEKLKKIQSLEAKKLVKHKLKELSYRDRLRIKSSISHRGKKVLVSFSKEYTSIGVDIEMLDNDRDFSRINKNPKDSFEAKSVIIWSIKEAIYKSICLLDFKNKNNNLLFSDIIVKKDMTFEVKIPDTEVSGKFNFFISDGFIVSTATII